jgi:hypothetical protein
MHATGTHHSIWESALGLSAKGKPVSALQLTVSLTTSELTVFSCIGKCTIQKKIYHIKLTIHI